MKSWCYSRVNAFKEEVVKRTCCLRRRRGGRSSRSSNDVDVVDVSGGILKGRKEEDQHRLFRLAIRRKEGRKRKVGEPARRGKETFPLLLIKLFPSFPPALLLLCSPPNHSHLPHHLHTSNAERPSLKRTQLLPSSSLVVHSPSTTYLKS